MAHGRFPFPLLIAALSLLLAACASVPRAGSGAAAPIARPAGYRLVWADEFNRNGLPDPAKWDYDTAFNKRGWHNDEKQYYAEARAKNSRVENGRLIIEAHVERLDPKSFPDWGGQNYTSARLFTRGKASWTYGYIEARAKLACGLGTWPAIWTLPDKPNMKWPDDGEIDIMEHVGQDPGTVHQTIHTAAFNHVLKTQKAGTIKLPDACEAFHLYQLHWTPERLHMGVDGRTVFTFDRTDRGRAEWPFDGPHYLLLNLAMGGWGSGDKGIDDKALPARMVVDYVRVYQAAGDADAMKGTR
jgi:beta-glucanase (GH16 family)